VSQSTTRLTGRAFARIECHYFVNKVGMSLMSTGLTSGIYARWAFDRGRTAGQDVSLNAFLAYS
jgi:hypothetical protein